MLKWDWELGLGVGELGLLGFVYGHGIMGYKDVIHPRDWELGVKWASVTPGEGYPLPGPFWGGPCMGNMGKQWDWALYTLLGRGVLRVN